MPTKTAENAPNVGVWNHAAAPALAVTQEDHRQDKVTVVISLRREGRRYLEEQAVARVRDTYIADARAQVHASAEYQALAEERRRVAAAKQALAKSERTKEEAVAARTKVLDASSQDALLNGSSRDALVAANKALLEAEAEVLACTQLLELCVAQEKRVRDRVSDAIKQMARDLQKGVAARLKAEADKVAALALERLGDELLNRLAMATRCGACFVLHEDANRAVDEIADLGD